MRLPALIRWISFHWQPCGFWEGHPCSPLSDYIRGQLKYTQFMNYTALPGSDLTEIYRIYRHNIRGSCNKSRAVLRSTFSWQSPFDAENVIKGSKAFWMHCAAPRDLQLYWQWCWVSEGVLQSVQWAIISSFGHSDECQSKSTDPWSANLNLSHQPAAYPRKHAGNVTSPWPWGNASI